MRLSELRVWSRDQLLDAGVEDVGGLVGYWTLPAEWRAPIVRELQPGDLVADLSPSEGYLTLWGLPVRWDTDTVPYLHLGARLEDTEADCAGVASWWYDRLHAGFTVLRERVDHWDLPEYAA